MALIVVLAALAAVDVLGGDALKAAERVQEATEKLIRVCNSITYILFIVGVALGLYATLGGHRVEAPE